MKDPRTPRPRRGAELGAGLVGVGSSVRAGGVANLLCGTDMKVVGVISGSWEFDALVGVARRREDWHGEERGIVNGCIVSGQFAGWIGEVRECLPCRTGLAFK